MAELQLPNFVGSYQQAYANAAEQRRMQENERRRNQLAGLASQAYAAPEEQRAALVQQAVGIDPDAGFGLDKQLRSGDDAREAALLNSARMIDAAPEPLKNAIFQQVKPRIAQHLPGLPDAYNEQVGQGIKAFIASRSGGSDAAVQSRFVGEDGTVYALMRDSSVKPLMGPDGRPLKADPRTQIIEGAGGFYGVDQRNLRATPVQIGPMGGQSVGQSVIDPAIPQNVQDAIRANPQAWESAPDGASIRIPGGQDQFGGNFTPTAAQLQAPGPDAVEAERLRLANEAAARDEERLRLAQEEARRRAAGGRPALSAGEAAKVRTQAKDMRDAINAFRAFDEAVAETPSLMAAQFNPGLKGRLGTSYNNARSSLRILYNTGVLQPGELPMLENALRDPSSFSGALDPRTRGQLRAQLDELYKLSQSNIENLVNSYPQVFNRDTYNANAPRPVGQQAAQGRYRVGQVIEAGGKRYRVTGGDMNDPDVEEVR